MLENLVPRAIEQLPWLLWPLIGLSVLASLGPGILEIYKWLNARRSDRDSIRRLQTLQHVARASILLNSRPFRGSPWHDELIAELNAFVRDKIIKKDSEYPTATMRIKAQYVGLFISSVSVFLYMFTNTFNSFQPNYGGAVLISVGGAILVTAFFSVVSFFVIFGVSHFFPNIRRVIRFTIGLFGGFIALIVVISLVLAIAQLVGT